MSDMSVLYVTASPFSGSTLLSFLLNDHDEITTVGHMTGWPEATDDFPCSCAKPLRECPFYMVMKRRFEEEGLSFDTRDFGTAYRLVGNERLNRVLIGRLPFLDHTKLEIVRDKALLAIPSFRRAMTRTGFANRLFISTALHLNNASVFVDNSHGPYRLRHLSHVPGLRLYPVHLVRDPRGTILSSMTHSGWSIESATRLWLSRYCRIRRILRESEQSMLVHYEDLCSEPDDALAALHHFIGVSPQPFSGDFKRKPHHILGNDMRMRSGTVQVDQRWKRDLSGDQIRYVEREIQSAARRNPQLSKVVDRYLS